MTCMIVRSMVCSTILNHLIRGAPSGAGGGPRWFLQLKREINEDGGEGGQRGRERVGEERRGRDIRRAAEVAVLLPSLMESQRRGSVLLPIEIGALAPISIFFILHLSSEVGNTVADLTVSFFFYNFLLNPLFQSRGARSPSFSSPLGSIAALRPLGGIRRASLLLPLLPPLLYLSPILPLLSLLCWFRPDTK